MIREGQGLFINGGVLHGIWDMENSGCRFISIVYHPRLVGGSADSIFWQRYAQPILSDARLRGICLNGDESWHGAALRHIRTAWLAVADEWEAYELEARDALSRLLFLILKNRAEVGAECGFPDTSYFIKSFRRWKGCTPGEYRRQSRKT